MRDRQRMTAHVTGRVQGVGFRWWIRSRAAELNLTGWVMNDADERQVAVVAEGATPRDGVRSIVGKAHDQAERLGGIGALVAAELERLTGKEARTVVLGHLLRGGTPTALDRLLGTRFGAAASITPR